MHIVFITPASALRRFPVYRLGSRFYGHPNAITGPLILGGILKKAGHTAEVYEELNGKVPLKKCLEKADVFSLYTMTSTAPRAYELADIIHASSDAKVIIGGIHASALPEEAAAHADHVIVGEGESVILDVVEGRLTDKIIRTSPPEDLDALPLPDYSILKTPCDCANIMTTRGCTCRCSFCTTSRMFAPYRQRSVDSVIEEIRLYKKMGFRYMNFEDDNFTADKERAKEICRRMIAENLTFKETFFFGRTDMAEDEELMGLLKKAHLNRVLIGIESLNEKALEQIHKGQNRDDILRAAKSCREHKIRLIASLVLGIDADTKEDIRRAVQFAADLDAYQLQPAILTPYPGALTFQQFQKEERMLVPDWEQYDMMNTTFIPKNLTPWELQDEFYHAVTKFYSFSSAFRIGRLFGRGYAVRRLGLWFFAHLGAFGARFASRFAKGTFYYKLRHGIYEESWKDAAPVLYSLQNNIPVTQLEDALDDSETASELQWQKEQLIS